MKVICLEEDAFYELIETVVDRLRGKDENSVDRFISPEDAMELLGIKSPNTLQKYRDEGRIEFSQLSRKKILYDRYSILEYLENKRKKSF
jgi:hypothetical protein